VEVEDPGLGPEVSRLERPISVEPKLAGTTLYTFPGGCVTLRYDFAEDAPSTLLLEVLQAIDLFPRKEAVELLEDEDGLLCGADAPPCVGETGS
jgi:hypothetical protein